MLVTFGLPDLLRVIGQQMMLLLFTTFKVNYLLYACNSPRYYSHFNHFTVFEVIRFDLPFTVWHASGFVLDYMYAGLTVYILGFSSYYLMNLYTITKVYQILMNSFTEIRRQLDVFLPDSSYKIPNLMTSAIEMMIISCANFHF